MKAGIFNQMSSPDISVLLYLSHHRLFQSQQLRPEHQDETVCGHGTRVRFTTVNAGKQGSLAWMSVMPKNLF